MHERVLHINCDCNSNLWTYIYINILTFYDNYSLAISLPLRCAYIFKMQFDGALLFLVRETCILIHSFELQIILKQGAGGGRREISYELPLRAVKLYNTLSLIDRANFAPRRGCKCRVLSGTTARRKPRLEWSMNDRLMRVEMELTPTREPPAAATRERERKR